MRLDTCMSASRTVASWCMAALLSFAVDLVWYAFTLTAAEQTALRSSISPSKSDGSTVQRH